MDWTHLTKDKNKLRAVVNLVMNFQFYKIRGIPALDNELRVTLESLCFVELVTEVVRDKLRHFNVKARGAGMCRINNCTL